MRLRIPVQVRWNDLDAYGHVNNAAAFTLLEEARIRAFWANPDDPDPWPTAVLPMGPGADHQTLVARQEIEYLRPVPFLRHGIVIELWIGRLGGSSIELCYAVKDLVPAMERVGSELEGTPYTMAATTLVLVTTSTGRPTRITPEQRAAWEPFIEEPIRFRHRR